jgi:hypothetical protein
MRLLIDDAEVARHDGPHRHAPLFELVEAWRQRCLAMGHAPRAGEVVTFGSLTGVQPLPAAAAPCTASWPGAAAWSAHRSARMNFLLFPDRNSPQ